jgi:predicted PurR-regulated permease PerM
LSANTKTILSLNHTFGILAHKMSTLSENNRFSISTGTIVRFFGIGVLILVLYQIFNIVIVVLAAVVIASAMEPVVRRLRYHFGFHRVLSVIILYLLLIAVLAAVVVFFVPLVLSDISDFLASMPSTVSLDNLWGPIKGLGINLGPISNTFSAYTIPLSDFVGNIQKIILGTSTGALQTASLVFGGLLSFLLIMVLSFYLAVQEEGVDDFLRIIAPVRKHDYIINLWKRSQRKIGFWMQGQILLGIIVGVLVYIVLKVVGIPFAFALAVLAAIFEIIPVFGPIISSIPAIFIAFADRGVGTGLLLVGLYIIIYQFESQLFYPLVVQKIVGINSIVVILSLVIGAQLAGLLGAIIAVPLSAALMEYVNDIEKRKKNEKSNVAQT